MFLLIIFIFNFFIIVACENQQFLNDNNLQTSNENQHQPDEGTANIEFSLDYMKNLMVAPKNITGYSIRINSNQPQNLSNNTQCKIFLLSATLLEQEQEKPGKYSLYSTSETYQFGDVEFDESTITKVTFKKNTEVKEDIYDNDGNLIDQSTIITQDQLDGQINKLYTTKDYTFIQFVAKVSASGNYSYMTDSGEVLQEYITLRPDSLIYDEFGVADFDKTDYYSSALTASFVIDNATNFIYKIDNFHIKAFCNGLVQDSRNYYYSITTDDNNNLVFTDVLPNKEVKVNNVLKDKYGWIFVANSDIDLKIEEKKLIYTTATNYIYDNEYNIYSYDYYPETLLQKLVNVYIDGRQVPLVNTKLILGLISLTTDRSDDVGFSFYKDMRVSNLNLYGPLGVVIAENYEKNYGLYYDTNNSINAYWLDNTHNIFILNTEGILSYYYVDLELIYQKKTSTILTVDDLVQLNTTKLRIENEFYLQIDNDKIKQVNVYSSQGINGVKYYKLVKNGHSLELIELTSKTYEDSIYVFQPINRM